MSVDGECNRGMRSRHSTDTMQDATSASEGGRACANCGTPAPGRFCPHCGQSQAPRLTSIRHLMGEVLENSFSLEARLPRTVLGLIFRPAS